MRPLAPMPRAPRRRYRDFEEQGHHHRCACSQESDFERDYYGDGYPPCTCWELDEEDYQAACEEKYDAWKNGDYD